MTKQMCDVTLVDFEEMESKYPCPIHEHWSNCIDDECVKYCHKDHFSGTRPLDGVSNVSPFDGMSNVSPFDGVSNVSPFDGMSNVSPFDSMSNVSPFEPVHDPSVEAVECEKLISPQEGASDGSKCIKRCICDDGFIRLNIGAKCIPEKECNVMLKYLTTN